MSLSLHRDLGFRARAFGPRGMLSVDHADRQTGTIIEALEMKKTEDGVNRVRFSEGWVSEQSGDGRYSPV